MNEYSGPCAKRAFASCSAARLANGDTVPAASLQYVQSTKTMPGLQNEVLAVWEKTERMSDAYKQIDELSLRRKRNPRPWPYLPP